MRSLKIPRFIIVLLLFTVANLVILSIRNKLVGDHVFNSLMSNLWSGIVPLIIAIGIHLFYRKLNTFFFIVLSLGWLLFYPNSPYMISDLIHPGDDPKNASIEWLIVYDTLIIFSLAILSLFYGFVSLKIMFNLFRERFGNKTAHVIIFFSLALSCLGFYIGRVLHSGDPAFGNGYLYSSQIFTEPLFIFKAVWNAIFPIKEHLPAYYMMGLIGFAQYQLLIMMKDVGDFEGAEAVTKK